MARAEIKTSSSLDSRRFDQGIAKMGQRVRSFASGELAALGKKMAAVFAAQQLWSGFRGLGGDTDSIRNMATALGLTTDQVQALEYQAKQLGVPFDQVQAAMIRLKDAQDEVAVSGNKSLAEAFDRLHVSMQEILTLPIDALMDKVAQGMQKSATSTKDLNNLLGRGGGRMKEYLATLQRMGGVAGATQDAIKKGVVMEPAAMAAADKANDWIDTKLQQGKMMGANLMNLSADEQKAAEERERQVKAANDQAEAEGRIAAAAKRQEEARTKITDKMAKVEAKVTVADASSDQLQRLGSMLGTAGIAQQNDAKKGIAIAQKQEELLKELADLNDQIASNTSNLTE